MGYWLLWKRYKKREHTSTNRGDSVHETLEEYRKRILALALKRVEEMKENDKEENDRVRIIRVQN